MVNTILWTNVGQCPDELGHCSDNVTQSKSQIQSKSNTKTDDELLLLKKLEMKNIERNKNRNPGYFEF